MAWLGPAIEPDAFEVGEEVRKQFIARDAKTEAAFEPNARGRWQADLHALARLELASLGVHDVYSTSHRCFAENDKFFSYRREGKTGRMATMGWVAP